LDEIEGRDELADLRSLKRPWDGLLRIPLKVNARIAAM